MACKVVVSWGCRKDIGFFYLFFKRQVSSKAHHGLEFIGPPVLIFCILK